jgi:hypothetical protein
MTVGYTEVKENRKEANPVHKLQREETISSYKNKESKDGRTQKELPAMLLKDKIGVVTSKEGYYAQNRNRIQKACFDNMCNVQKECHFEIEGRSICNKV